MTGGVMKRYGLWASAILSVPSMVLGGISLLWSLVCLLGGPDGKLGDPESFVYAFLFGIVGFMVVLYSWKWFRWSLDGISAGKKKTIPNRAFSTTGEAVMKGRTGEKIGWTVGFSGAFLWVVILSLIFLIQNRLAQGLSGLLLFGLGALSILFFAPWRRPSTPYWKLMVPIYALFFGAVVWAIWAFGCARDPGLSWWSLFLLLPMLLPFGTMGKKTWNDFGNQSES